MARKMICMCEGGVFRSVRENPRADVIYMMEAPPWLCVGDGTEMKKFVEIPNGGPDLFDDSSPAIMPHDEGMGASALMESGVWKARQRVRQE